MKRYYLAYGSNLHVPRLQRRVSSASPLDVIQISGYRLTFDKFSRDGSGKCNALYTGKPEDVLNCALYEIERSQKPLLDRAEGLGFGYFQAEFPLARDSRRTAFIYLSHPAYRRSQILPFSWYRELVLRGAEHHEFHPSYVERIRQVRSTEDWNKTRNRKMMRIAHS